jgi:hypothetical protein
MKGGPNIFAKSNKNGLSESALEEEIEHLKDLLLDHDRSLSHKLSRGEKPSLEEKRARSRIIRQLNRTRRQLYRLVAGIERQPAKRVTFRLNDEDYANLQNLAQEEGMSLSAYIRKQLFPDK